MLYTHRHTLYQLTNPLQFPHEPPGFHEPHFGKPWRSIYTPKSIFAYQYHEFLFLFSLLFIRTFMRSGCKMMI